MEFPDCMKNIKGNTFSVKVLSWVDVMGFWYIFGISCCCSNCSGHV